MIPLSLADDGSKKSGEDAMGLKIRNCEVFSDLNVPPLDYPKYTYFLVNKANEWGHGTRPKVVGKVTDLIKEFPGSTFDEWVEWYTDKHPDAVDKATSRIMGMLTKFRSTLDDIDEDFVRRWVTDFLLSKTFSGLRFQASILKRVAELKGTSYRLATSEEESKGIDGYIGDTAVSIKPESYKSMTTSLSESISAEMIYYKKQKKFIEVEFGF